MVDNQPFGLKSPMVCKE